MKGVKKYYLFIFIFHTFWIQSQDVNKKKIQKEIMTFKKEIITSWTKNPEYSLKISNKAIDYCDSLKLGKQKVYFMNFEGISYYYLGKFNDANSVYQRAAKLLENYSADKTTADIYNMFSIIKRKIHQPDSAIFYGQKSLEIRKNLKLINDVAGSYDDLANVYNELGDYKKAIELQFKAMEIFKEQKNEKELALVYGNLSGLYQKLKDEKKSLEFLDKAINIFKKEKDFYSLADSYSIKADHYFDVGNYQEAINLLKKSNEYYSKIKVLDGQGDILFSLGKIYEKKKDYKKALDNFKKASDYYRKSGVKLPLVKSMLYQTKILIYQKQLNAAKNNLDKISKMLGDKFSDERLLFYQIQLKYFKSIGNYKKSTQIAELLMNTKDSLNKINMQAAIDKKLLQMKLERQKLANINLTKEKKILALKNRQMKLTTIGGVSLGILSFVSLILFIQKRKKEKHINELKIREEKLKAERLEEKMQYNTRKLTGFTLNLAQKNLLLRDLLKIIRKIEQEKTDDFRTLIYKMKMKISNSFNTEDDWKRFNYYFEQIHPDFYKKLKKDYPKLSSNELKLAAMIRLNMNIKQTASILNMEPNAVRIARYRLRKKIGLQRQDSLYNFMQKI